MGLQAGQATHLELHSGLGATFQYFDTTHHPGEESQERTGSRNCYAREIWGSKLVSSAMGCGNMGHVFKYRMALMKQREWADCVVVRRFLPSSSCTDEGKQQS